MNKGTDVVLSDHRRSATLRWSWAGSWHDITVASDVPSTTPISPILIRLDLPLHFDSQKFSGRRLPSLFCPKTHLLQFLIGCFICSGCLPVSGPSHTSFPFKFTPMFPCSSNCLHGAVHCSHLSSGVLNKFMFYHQHSPEMSYSILWLCFCSYVNTSLKYALSTAVCAVLRSLCSTLQLSEFDGISNYYLFFYQSFCWFLFLNTFHFVQVQHADCGYQSFQNHKNSWNEGWVYNKKTPWSPWAGQHFMGFLHYMQNNWKQWPEGHRRVCWFLAPRLVPLPSLSVQINRPYNSAQDCTLHSSDYSDIGNTSNRGCMLKFTVSSRIFQLRCSVSLQTPGCLSLCHKLLGFLCRIFLSAYWYNHWHCPWS